jgi:serine protease inhibitor
MMLINTLYFEAEWQRMYDDSYSSHFTDINGNVHDIDMLSGEEFLYYDLGNADAFKKPYKGNYSFVGILPHEDVDFNEYIKGLDSEKLLNDIKVSEDPSTFELHVSIPKFKYNYSQTLKPVLSEMGMPSAFNEYAADFSKINDQTIPLAEQLFIGDVLHKTRIELTEKGTKAAAVTAVYMEATCVEPVKLKKIYITLNRPFVYMIVDENNVPAFIGAVTSLKKE